MSKGISFQCFGAATKKALSPYLFRRTFGTSNKCLPADLRFLEGLYGTISWLKYGGARLLRALKVNTLKVIRCSTDNQCSSLRTGRMCAALGCPATRRAASGFLSQFSIDSSFNYLNELFKNTVSFTVHKTDKQWHITRERLHGQIRKQDNLIKRSFCSPNERWEITLRPNLPSYLILKAVEISLKLSKIHVFITQTRSNHPEIGTRYATKMVIYAPFFRYYGT